MGAITLNVAREKGAVRDGGMRANKEVGQDVALATAGSSVAQKGLARKKECGARNLGHDQRHPVDDGVERFYASERHGQLGIYDRVDGELMDLGLRAQLASDLGQTV